jgi:hypothetical protein
MTRKLAPSEHAIQAAFVEWCRLNEKRYPGLDLAFAVPNAAKRSMGLAMRMRKEGLRAGVCDWWLPVWRPREEIGTMGLVIEFKSKIGKLTEVQSQYMSCLEDEGWRVEVCRSTEEAIAVVKSYYGE